MTGIAGMDYRKARDIVRAGLLVARCGPELALAFAGSIPADSIRPDS